MHREQMVGNHYERGQTHSHRVLRNDPIVEIIHEALRNQKVPISIQFSTKNQRTSCSVQVDILKRATCPRGLFAVFDACSSGE